MKKIILLTLMCMVLLVGSVSAITWDNSAYYKFNESSGDLIDDVNGIWNGTVTSITSRQVENQGSPTRINTGYEFNGAASADVIDIQNNTSGKSPAGSPKGTVSIWFNASFNSDATGTKYALMGADGELFTILFDETGSGSNFQVILGNTKVVSVPIAGNKFFDAGDWVNMIVTWDDSTENVTLYINNIMNWSKTGTSFTGVATANLDIGDQRGLGRNWDGVISEVGIWKRVLTRAEITDLYNNSNGESYGGVVDVIAPSISITLNSPSNNSKESGGSIIFNSTSIPVVLNLINSTIYVWNSSNGVFDTTTNNITGNETNITSWNINNFALGSTYHWNVYGCGDNSSGDAVCAWASSNRTFTSSAFSELTATYNTSIFETSRQSIIFNISANPSVSSASASLWYNGTEYTSTVTDGTAGIYKAVNTLDIPLVNADGNKTFNWEWDFTLTDGTTLSQNTTTFSHEVNRTWLALCNATYFTPFINFTTKSAENPYPEVNVTLKTAWEWWLGSGGITRNYSYEDESETKSHFGFCMSPNQTYTTNLQAEFDGADYSQNYHYLTNASLTNITNNISLYLLNDSKATLTVLTVYDQAQSPLEDVYIQIQLYDVGTDTFYTVGMAKTAFNGEDIAYLNWYDTLYKFVLTQDGTVVKTTTPYKISETPQIFEIATVTTYVYDKFQDFLYSLYFNNVTNNFVLTFTKPSGLVDSGCLRVIKRNPSNDSQICLVCETSSSATLYCNIANQGNGTFIASFYATGSLKVIDTISTFIGSVNEIYDLIGNTDGSAYAFLFAGIILAMFFVHPVLGVIGIILGMLGAMIMGFQPINYLEFMGIVILGGIVIWILKR